MATWGTRTRRITRREWVVPMYSGASDHTQLLQALYDARQARARVKAGYGEGELVDVKIDLCDTDLMVSVGDDEIVIWYQTEQIGID